MEHTHDMLAYIIRAVASHLLPNPLRPHIPPSHATDRAGSGMAHMLAERRSERHVAESALGMLEVQTRVHRLPRAQVLDLGSSSLQSPRLVKLTDDVQWLSHHIGVDVPQPAHKSLWLGIIVVVVVVVVTRANVGRGVS